MKQEFTQEQIDIYLRERLERAHAKAKSNPSEWVPRDRVVAVVQAWLRRFEREAMGPSWDHAAEGERFKAGAKQALAERMGISHRRLFALLADETAVYARLHRDGRSRLTGQGGEPYLSVGVVDRLFVAMGCTELWHLPPERGGFSDVYEADFEAAA